MQRKEKLSDGLDPPSRCVWYMPPKRLEMHNRLITSKQAKHIRKTRLVCVRTWKEDSATSTATTD
jgi:hypothetical protein